MVNRIKKWNQNQKSSQQILLKLMNSQQGNDQLLKVHITHSYISQVPVLIGFSISSEAGLECYCISPKY